MVLEKALAVFKDAFETERRVDKVVIRNKDDDILTELSGFSPGATSAK